MKKSTSGFTVIELLIVIIVITILAAITILSYAAIRDKANGAKIVAAVDAYEKIARQYKDVNGSYFDVGGKYTCLGDDWPAKDGFPAGSCYMYNGTSQADSSPALNAAFKTVNGQLPTGRTDVVDQAGVTKSRGPWYYTYYTTSGGVNTAYTVQIIYFVTGSQPCGRGVADQQGSYTLCKLTIANDPL